MTISLARAFTQRLPLIIWIAVSVVGCSARAPAAEITSPTDRSAGPTRASGEPPHRSSLKSPELRVIVDAHAGDKFYTWAAPAGFFTPSEEQISTLEALLPRFLDDHVQSRDGESPLSERMPKYMRHYVGIIKANGARRIWGNFFCVYFDYRDPFGPKDGWRTHGISVSDGGDCYFNVKFDPTFRTFSELAVNGNG